MSKIRLEDIQAELNNEGWKVISTSYEKLDVEMEFECPEGHHVHTTWKKLRSRRECPICSQNSFANLDTIKDIIPKKKGSQRIIALDQSTHITGYSIFDDGVPISYGIFNAKGNDEIVRDLSVRMWLVSLIENWKPDYIGIEGIQFQEDSEGEKKKKMGVTVFQALARLQGILMCTCEERKVPYEVCSTNTWRNFCGVKGVHRTDKKRSMQLLAKEWYDITVSDDIADAIGIGKYVSSKYKQSSSIVNWE